MRGSQSAAWSHTQLRTQRWRAIAAVLLSLVVSFLSASKAFASYGSPTATNPIGSPTAPPSSYQGGLVPTPNPLQNGNNDVITGNVRGFKQFRGPVPYDSPTSFGGPLGSTRLDSFLRSSAVPPELSGPAPGYDTFYSPTGTVSTIRPGQSGVFAPAGPRMPGGLGQYRAEQPADVTDFGDVRQPRVSAGQTSPTLDGHWDAWHTPGDWPLSRTPEQMNQIITDELGRQIMDRRVSPQYDQPMSPEEYGRQLEHFRQELERIKANASQLEQSLRVGEDLSREAPEQVPAEAPGSRPILEGMTPAPDHRGGEQPLQPTAPPTDVSAFARQTQGQAPAIQEVALLPGENPMLDTGSDTPSASPIQRRNQPDDGQLIPDASSRIDRIAEVFLPQRQSSASQNQTAEPGELPALRRMRETASAFAPASESPAYPPADPADSVASTLDRTAALLERFRSAPPAVDATPEDGDENTDSENPQASSPPIDDQPPSNYENLDGPSREKFERYMNAAHLYLAQDRFYRAAESFALASLYNPREPRVYLGRSHALFAAGEYVSSSVFLARAMELDAARTLAKLDMVNATGGPDPFVRRTLELERRAQANDAPDLQFLMAYIYYQMDRPQEARTAIDAAKKGLPYSLAVDLLLAAIGR